MHCIFLVEVKRQWTLPTLGRRPSHSDARARVCQWVLAREGDRWTPFALDIAAWFEDTQPLVVLLELPN
jgi:hypothetical protein